MNHRAKYRDQRLFRWKIINVRTLANTQTLASDQLFDTATKVVVKYCVLEKSGYILLKQQLSSKADLAYRPIRWQRSWSSLAPDYHQRKSDEWRKNIAKHGLALVTLCRIRQQHPGVRA